MEETVSTGGNEALVVQVCMGSSCFLRGSGEIVAEIKRLVEEHGLDRKIILKGSFCMEKCTTGVTVKIGDKLFTGVYKEDVPGLFSYEMLPRVAG